MGDKKGKSLALELMDDLLNEEVESFEIGGKDPADNDLTEAVNVSNPNIGGDADVSDSMSFKSSRVKESDISDFTEKIDDVSEPVHEFSSASHEHDDQDRTVRVTVDDKTHVRPSQKDRARKVANDGVAEDRVRASVGRFAPYRSSGGGSSSTEVALAQSESLRIAQSRLIEFEQEIERLRLQNEELAAAAETLRRRADELSSLNQKRESEFESAASGYEQEKEILLASKEGVQREMQTLRQRNEELELRISSNIQKIRVRERELENRLELVKMESAALIRSKDEMILELKRNIDQLNLELNNYRAKNQELNRHATEKQEQQRRTVKALRLALSMLEGEEEVPAKAAGTPLRKAK